MGIRIHKVLGYGLDDVAYDRDNWQFADPRINSKSFLINDEAPVPSLDEYRAWLDKNVTPENAIMERWWFADRDKHGAKRYRDRIDLRECFTHSPEFGLPNVLILCPFGHDKWMRYDDPIDYVEAGNEALDTVQILSDGIYPYVATYVDVRDGRRLDERVRWWIRSGNFGSADKRLDELAHNLGFENHAQALELIRPEVPEPIQNLCRFASLFTDEAHIRYLRPMVYTYWS